MNLSTTAVILLNWRGAIDTIECIRSLLSSGIDLANIIIVDNDSQDSSVTDIKNSFPGAFIIESNRNGGFAYGCNIGIQTALKKDYKYVWLLNNDTTVSESTLPSMLRCASEGKYKIIGSVLRDACFPWEVQSIGGGDVNFLSGATKHILKPEDLVKLDYITGASMLIDRSVIVEIGLLDEDFFMYWEDVEFCIRARKKGYSMGVAFNSVVYHKEGASAKKSSYRQTRMISTSTRIFFKKTTKIYLFPILIQQFGKSVKSFIRGDIGRIFYLWR